MGDLSSHWLSMTATHATGQSSHKAIDLSKNVFLKLYYTSRPVLFSVCAANEWMWMMLYLARFLGDCSGTWASTDAHADPVHALWSPPATGCRSVSPYCSSSSICAPQQSP